MTRSTICGTASWNGLAASRAWKNTSGFWAEPRSTGRSGVSPRSRCSWIFAASTSCSRSSGASCSILATSCEVRKPSKKCRNGTRASSVAAWAIAAMSCASWTEAEHSMAQPVVRAAMTSLWSPKIDSAWVATVRAATWTTAGVSSPAILNMLGSISSSPCDAVKVVAREPACSAPCREPAAPASLCISTTRGTLPNTLRLPAAAQASASSPIVEAGVMG
jgi:hypothetical protein